MSNYSNCYWQRNILYVKVESTLAMQNLQPTIKAIQERYKGNQVMYIFYFIGL